MTGIKYIRAEVLNKTLEELAETLGVSRQILCMWEAKKKKIPQSRVEQLAEISGIPGEYFLREEIRERDKLEIKKYWLNKELGNAAEEYEDMNTALLEQIEFTESQIKVTELLQRINSVIRAGDKMNDATANDVADSIETRRVLYDRFTDVVEDNVQMDLLFSIVRVMELFFDAKVKKNHLWGEEPLIPQGMLDKEKEMVRDLYLVLHRYEREKIKENNNRIRESKEIMALLDESGKYN